MNRMKGQVLELFPNEANEEELLIDNSSTFVNNMTLPIHRWYRYTAGFSAVWARQLIGEQKKLGRIKVIDPFAGSGTVLLESEFETVESIGLEAQPYIYRIAKSKLTWNFSPTKFKEAALALLQIAKNKKPLIKKYPELISSCYPITVIEKLDRLKQSWFEDTHQAEIKDLIWFVITSILRVTSPVGTAQWQYIQPGKTKAKIIDPFDAFEKKIHEMCSDMRLMQARIKNPTHSCIFNEDARDIKSIPDGWGDLAITSPPYANNYDYADATRLEMTFWGDIQGWGDLQTYVRHNLIRACTQHVSKLETEIDGILSNPKLNSIKSELLEVFYQLKGERLKHGGKKNYHLMIAAYFSDLSEVMHSLRRVTSDNALMCFVIGDSAPYGIYVPVEKWLGELAVSAGFESYHFEKLRDRNIKWKNRKHRVPLKEGRLWIKG